MKKLVLLDLDNTLLPFSFYWEQANIEIFNSSNLTKNLEYDSFIGLYRKYDKELWGLHTQQLITLDELRQQRLIKTMKDFQITVSVDEAQNYFDEFFHNLIDRIIPDSRINNMLLSLQKNYKVGILTNGKITEQKQKIEKMKLNDAISSNQIFISDEIGYEKPDPKSFHYVLNELGMRNVESIYVGDSWGNDIVGAIDAGLEAIWVNEDNVLTKNSYNGSKVIEISSILNLENVLQSINNTLAK
ncbi:HAD family hydrolase [Paraliobacillus sp. JSM ZJ581]|uniref:HAD family hydrolase n=1 Tax=Paraliobacillus sp. JSM ZJ581 TaxID=3342118 RepID=UPI0035A833D9